MECAAELHRRARIAVPRKLDDGRFSTRESQRRVQARIVELLVERVDLQPDGIDLRLRIEGLTSLCSELRASGGSHQEAA